MERSGRVRGKRCAFEGGARGQSKGSGGTPRTAMLGPWGKKHVSVTKTTKKNVTHDTWNNSPGTKRTVSLAAKEWPIPGFRDGGMDGKI